jgi:hypothetical protein
MGLRRRRHRIGNLVVTQTHTGEFGKHIVAAQQVAAGPSVRCATRVRELATTAATITIPSRDAKEAIEEWDLFDAELAELMLVVLIARGGRRGRWRRHAYCRLVIELTASSL